MALKLFDPPESTNGATPITNSNLNNKTSRRRQTRRNFLRSALAGGTLAALGSAGYAWRIEPLWLQIIHRKMPIPNLQHDFDGFRIIQISDLHLGAGVPLEYLTKWIDWIGRRRPDLVVITGDIVHRAQTEWCGIVGKLLARIRVDNRPLVILGNHEWGAFSMGTGSAQTADRVTAAMIKEGLSLLRNESTVISRGSSRLYIVGMEDYWSGRFNKQTAFTGVPKSSPCIALSHNPDSFIDLLDTPASWILSGHTHGGQVSIPLLGPILIPIQHKQFVAGHYQLDGKNLYVNRGIGWFKRVRFNARPEITEFTLTHI
ncbi:MAG: metallophosphoesterase [Planctomycetota bacterium]|nr:MAG: metallophosphoesterase [Planctomycetota bacterium]